MAHIDVEKKLKDILFERGMVLTYNEIEPSSPEDMYEVTFYLNGEVYRTNASRDPYRDEKVTFTFVPNEGYELSSVTHNGTKVSVSNIDATNEYKTYTVTVVEDISLEVKFSKIEVEENENPITETPVQDLVFINGTRNVIIISSVSAILIAGLVILLIVLKKRKNNVN
jgi:hypothetical protein